MADPWIVFAKRVEPAARAITANYEARIDAPTRAAAERIAKARFAVYGTRMYPNATFSLQLSYGIVAGFDANGTAVPPYTNVAGLAA